ASASNRNSAPTARCYPKRWANQRVDRAPSSRRQRPRLFFFGVFVRLSLSEGALNRRSSFRFLLDLVRLGVLSLNERALQRFLVSGGTLDARGCRRGLRLRRSR